MPTSRETSETLLFLSNYAYTITLSRLCQQNYSVIFTAGVAVVCDRLSELFKCVECRASNATQINVWYACGGGCSE